MRATLLALVPLSFLGVACGGTDEGRFSYDAPETSEPDPCEADRGYEFLSVLDFEPHLAGADGLSTQLTCNPAFPSSCSFYFNYDKASSPPNPASPGESATDCVELVDADAEVTTKPRITGNIHAEPIARGRCGRDSYGLNIVTENVGMCYGADGRLGWGAAFDINFADPPLDASDWDGVALWVKQAEGNAKPAFILQLTDPNTSGAQGSTCDASDPAIGEQPIPDSEKCDSFGTAVTLTEEWSFVVARFENLAQKGFGVVSPLGHLKVDEINRLQIFMNAGSADFWIDDISLFREAE